MEFRAPIEDIFFSLQTLGAAELPEWDGDLSRQIGEHFASFAESVLAPLNSSGDIEGCRLENGRVRMPVGFPEAYKQLANDGWQGLTAPKGFGGQGMSVIVSAVISEIFSGANHSFQMLTGLVPGAVRVLLQFGTVEQQSKYIPRLASGEMLATMCLTEAGAGSDLTAIRAKATERNGQWFINGEKIFISGGDQDLSDDILHLVLARSSEEPLAGLSLFLVEGRVNVTRIEDKMGLHASPTCQIVFVEREAELIGEAGQGLKAMFTMMNHARIDVALQGVAHAANAANQARKYSAERMQGGSPIADYADVKNMLNEADALAISSRAMVHLALIELEKGNRELVEFLTHLVKVYGSVAGMRAAELAMQVLGGYGYLRDYGIEQIYRDARVTAIYEGANGIHMRALATRAIKTGAAQAFGNWLNENAAPETATHWQVACERIAKSENSQIMAHDFAWLSAHILRLSLAEKMDADAHSDPVRMRSVIAHIKRRAPIEAEMHYRAITLG